MIKIIKTRNKQKKLSVDDNLDIQVFAEVSFMQNHIKSMFNRDDVSLTARFNTRRRQKFNDM